MTGFRAMQLAVEKQSSILELTENTAVMTWIKYKGGSGSELCCQISGCSVNVPAIVNPKAFFPFF